jgi:hypothetical protein
MALTPIKISATSFRGPFLLQKARDMAATASPESGDPDAVIILATAGLEAFVNALEGPGTSIDVHPRLIALAQVLFEAEKSRVQLTAKCELAHLVLTEKPIDRGSSQYQKLKQLVKLRNDLTHVKPIRGGNEVPLESNSHVRYFLANGLVAKVDSGFGGHLTWDRVVLIPAVARWAYNTTVTTMSWLSDLMPPCSATQSLREFWLDRFPLFDNI